MAEYIIVNFGFWTWRKTATFMHDERGWWWKNNQG